MLEQLWNNFCRWTDIYEAGIYAVGESCPVWSMFGCEVCPADGQYEMSDDMDLGAGSEDIAAIAMGMLATYYAEGGK